MAGFTIDGNGIYPMAYQNLMSGNIDLSSLVNDGSLKAALVDNTYMALADHEFFFNEIEPDDIATNGQVLMTGATIRNSTQGSCLQCGFYISSSATVFSAVDLSANAGTVGNIVMYIDGDNPGTNDYLIGLYMKDKNGDPIAVTPDGDDITVNWDQNQNQFLGCIFMWAFGQC